MKKLRQIHLYLGVLFAPSILFFAFTGAYQTFRWNENGSLGALSPVAQQMAAIHKNAALPAPERREGRGGGREGRGNREGGGKPSRDRTLPLKIYIFAMSLGLMVSTATGVALAFQYNRSRRLIWGLLAVGTVLPLILLWI